MKKMYISIFQKVMILCLSLFLSTQVYAQGRIELNSGSKGVRLSESSMKGFSTTFSYSSIETELVETEYGTFSKVIMSDAMSDGEIGTPSLPVSRKLIAVPFGAKPMVNVVNYTTTDYQLSDYGIERIYPQQPSYSKDTKIEEVFFQYNEKSYQTRSLNNAPEIEVEVLGTMRGIQIGSLQVEPVSYNPANNTIRVYNDIELEVVFEHADVQLTEEILVGTYSPYYNVVYKQLFNSKTISDVFAEHPDLYEAPVHMSVVAHSKFKDVIKPWLEWKTEKGFYIDVKYVESNTTSSQIVSYIRQQYDEVKPSFVVIFGDSGDVKPSLPYGQETSRVTDLYYGSLDGDYFPEVYYSRMSCETVAEMESLIEKVLQYEQYTMPDPSYLGNALMIAGVDNYWNPRVGTPAINYATNFYFNQAHGLNTVHKYTTSYSGCYNNLNNGVGFVNYTAHGVELGWMDPSFYVSDVQNLTNKDKYFWAMGNCCLTGDWGYTGGACLGESMIRANEKGAWGYIGSCPVTYWNEDYYFAVGATNVFGRMPNKSETETGAYDAFWMDDVYNTLSSVPFVGNLSVTNARSNSYQQTNGITTEYYWEAYHTLGDGSVMPFRCEPTDNTVSHLETLPMGLDYFTVTAAPSSYVALSKDGELLGAAMVGPSGSVDVTITPVVSGGDIKIVVTHPSHIPYVKTIIATPIEGPYVSLFEFSPQEFPVNQDNKMSLTFKNVGVDATVADAKVTLSSDSEYITFTDAEAIISPMNSEATTVLTDEFSFIIDKAVTDETEILINVKIEYESSLWENKFVIKVVTPVVSYDGFLWDGYFEPGGTYTVKAKFKNNGHYKAVNAIATASTTSEFITFHNTSYEAGTIEVGNVATCDFEFTIDVACPSSERLPINFALTADNNVSAEGSEIMMNSCNVVFTLKDEFGDGWGQSALIVEFDDGTPTETIEMPDGEELVKIYTVAIETKISVSFKKGMYSYECSYNIAYDNGTLIYDSKGQPKEGLNHEFVVNCSSNDEELLPIKNLVAKVDANKVTLTWDAPRSLTGYKVLRNDDKIAETDETTYVDSNVAVGTYIYSVIAVYDGGESEPTTLKVIVGDAIEEYDDTMFAVYPNPTKDVINIKSDVQRYEYQLINNLGQVVMSGVSAGEHTIFLENVNKGVYFLKLITDGEIRINKVMIQ